MAASIRRNLKSQSTVHVFDVNKSVCEKFVEQFSSFGQVEVSANPREVAAAVDVVVSMVPGAPEVSKVYLDIEDGIVSAPKNPQRLLIECSTIDTTTARQVADQIRKASQGIYVDAPVSVSLPS